MRVQNKAVIKAPQISAVLGCCGKEGGNVPHVNNQCLFGRGKMPVYR